MFEVRVKDTRNPFQEGARCFRPGDLLEDRGGGLWLRVLDGVCEFRPTSIYGLSTHMLTPAITPTSPTFHNTWFRKLARLEFVFRGY